MNFMIPHYGPPTETTQMNVLIVLKEAAPNNATNTNEIVFFYVF